MFRYSFKILPDRLKLIRLYPCGSRAKYQFRLRIWFSVALRPQRRVGLLGTWTEWEGGDRVKGSTAETARKRPERPWTAARTMEVLRRCPLAIAQRLVHCAIALSTAVLDRVTKTMSVAPLFVFGARVGHFVATPQSDVVGIWSRDLGVMATLSVRQKMPFFRAFITLRSQFHLHHRSRRVLTEIVSKITPNLGLVL